MRKSTTLLLLLIAALTAGCLTAVPDEQSDAPTAAKLKTVKILTIGNSFTRDATTYLGQIVEDDGRFELIHSRAWIGGSSMARHLKHVKEYEADNSTGKPYGGKSLKELLTSDQWDIVTIQQLSTLSDKSETYYPEGPELVSYIRQNAPQAAIWLHETWAYRADDPHRFSETHTQEDMYNSLREAYHSFARKMGITNIIPVGDAFQNARRHPDWQFKYPDPDFDYENPEMDALPNQDKSLNLGWFWRKRTQPVKFMLDTHHSSVRGRYLGACVWFERLFGEAPNSDFVPESMTADEVEFLQKIAHETVANEANNNPWLQ